MTRQYAVIGLGRFGRAIATTLAEKGVEVLAIDRELALVESIADEVSVAVSLDATVRANLEAHAVPSMDGIVIAMGEDFESSVLITAMAKEFALPTIVARAYNPTQRRILSLVGATQVVNPEEEMGKRLAQSLVEQDVVDFIDLPEGHELRNVRIEGKFAGRTLEQFREACVERIVAVQLVREVETESRGETSTRTVHFPLPLDDTKLEEGDVLAVIGPTSVLERL